LFPAGLWKTGHQKNEVMLVRIPVKLNCDSGICEHHFWNRCLEGVVDQKLSFEGSRLFRLIEHASSKHSAAVVNPRSLSMVVHLTPEHEL